MVLLLDHYKSMKISRIKIRIGYLGWEFVVCGIKGLWVLTGFIIF